jgi:S-adenosylmethionine uptake transporter
LLAPGNRNATAVGITLILLGYFVFALNDALGKYLVATFTVAQVVFIRAIGSFIILGPMLSYQNENPFRNVYRPGWQFVRALLAAADSALFYAACVYLPLADVLTFYMAGPIYVSVISNMWVGGGGRQSLSGSSGY